MSVSNRVRLLRVLRRVHIPTVSVSNRVYLCSKCLYGVLVMTTNSGTIAVYGRLETQDHAAFVLAGAGLSPFLSRVPDVGPSMCAYCLYARDASPYPIQGTKQNVKCAALPGRAMAVISAPL